MDQQKAEQYLEDLKEVDFNGWQVVSLIDHGKSAVVFKAFNGHTYSALKVFDKELVEKFGDEAQKERIQRELGLVGHNHPNMVQLIDGGINSQTGHLYIVMEYLDAPNLSKVIKRVPEDKIEQLVEQLASAAQFLEEQNLCHRDIKPENIVILDDYSRLVLLDFGVIRPIGVDGLTDKDGIHPFIGTLQYSSPEFLIRKEADSKEGWRALTFYQIGGVIHDLLMRRPLFENFKEPFATLVHAVAEEVPEISCDVSLADCANLAGRCLVKDPEVRVSLLDWDDFRFDKKGNLISAAKRRVAERHNLRRAISIQDGGANNEVEALKNADNFRKEFIEFIKTIVTSIRLEQDSVPLGQTNLVKEDTLRFSFETPSSDEASSFCCFVKLEIMDDRAKAVRLMGCGYLGTDADECWINGGINATQIFKGIYDTSAITSQLEAFIYLCIDQSYYSSKPSSKDIWMRGLPDSL